MIEHIHGDFTQKYTVLDTMQLVQVYDSNRNECFEIDLSFVLEKNSALHFTPIIMGSSSYKITITVILEDNAHAAISGAYALVQNQHCNLITRQYHLGKNSISNLAINGIAKDTAVTDYRGMIRIEKSAVGTHAHQENKTTLFDSNARATSIPSIEVLNHDVSCAHGSAIGPLDADHILYARARGITESDAKKIMVRSIFGQMLAKINAYDKEQLVAQLTNRIIGV